MTTQHQDKDCQHAITDQLEKICLPDEFNFALLEWGVYFVTEPGDVWCVIVSLINVETHTKL